MQNVNSFAKGLLALGLQKGDRVGIWSENSSEWLLTQYATAQVGLILVNVNPVYKPSELQFALNKVNCKALVFSESYKKSNFLGSVQEIFPELQSLAPCPGVELHLQSVPSMKHLIKVGTSHTAGMHRFIDVMSADTRDAASSLTKLFTTAKGLIETDDAINIQFTSGTTGSPKGATLTHMNIINNGFFVGETQLLTEKDRICISVPLFHCFGMVMGSLAAISHGSLMVLPSGSFEPEATLLAAAEERCTAMYGVPTMFISMMNHPRFAELQPQLKSSLRTGIMAGSPCPEAVMRRAIDLMGVKDITVCYGMTETSPVSIQSHTDDPLDKRVSTVGRSSPHLETRIANTEGRTVALGEKGEILTRGYSVMKGYWSGDGIDEVATREGGLASTGWMHTGDLAIMDKDGYVSVVGRLKDMVIRGGENVYPREIEELLYKHPKIADAQVIGVPDDYMGEEVAVWIKRNKQEQTTSVTTAVINSETTVLEGVLTEDEVRAFLSRDLAHYKVPRYTLFVDDFPMTTSGKIQKFVMREQTAKMIKEGLLPSAADAKNANVKKQHS